MRLALALAAAACGRVGFDPVGADAGLTGATPTSACAFRGATCWILENTYAPGASGTFGLESCDDQRPAVQFSGHAGGVITLAIDAPFDSVVHVLRGADCSAPQSGCVDVPGTNERVTLDGSLGDPLVVLVDGGCGYVSMGWAMGSI